MNQTMRSVILVVAIFLNCLTPLRADDLSALRQQVEETERAFAKTMEDRDFEAFQSFLSEEAIFFAGEKSIEGRQAVAESWAPYYQEAEPPFSWQPQTVAVLESGTLALSSGPVFSATGTRVGTFNSIWRLNEHGEWKIVFDKGGQYCPPPNQINDE